MTGAVSAVVDQGPGAIAELAADALRTVNHLTLAPPSPRTRGWEDVGDLYRVLGELGVLTERLPQAIDQLARHLESPAMRDRCRSDSGTQKTPAALLESAADELARAGNLGRDIGRHLAGARSAVSHLAPFIDEPVP